VQQAGRGARGTSPIGRARLREHLLRVERDERIEGLPCRAAREQCRGIALRGQIPARHECDGLRGGQFEQRRIAWRSLVR
jgi:hypothetical protein